MADRGVAATALDRANAEQRAASDPRSSAFVAASAGSGKTKLLTDRLLRLMMAGTRPERILCLTYTKAAAAEMTIRLNRRLGHWVAMPESGLDAELAALDIPPGPAARAQARRLFAEVLDLPGGMRIETIHAFCQSLLRRFPLEAGLSPHFMVEEAGEASARLREAREQVLADPAHNEAIAALAAETDELSFTALTARLNGEGLPALLRQFGAGEIAGLQYAALAAEREAPDGILRAGMRWARERQLRLALERIAADGTNTGRRWAQECLDWLALDIEQRLLKWAAWVGAHFTGAGEPRSLVRIIGVKLAGEPALHAELAQEQARIARLIDRDKAMRLAVLNAHLLSLAAPVVQRDAIARAEGAQLTYGDLIAMTGELLVNPGAAWVLYKLDGGIDHLLLDEAQDTAPRQWQIAHALAAEFFSGLGATERPRSIFAVGDPKQSIFSFQGADLASFERNRDGFRARVRAAGQPWLDGALSVSFRSTAPVLQLVDAVFADAVARDGVVSGPPLAHGISREGQAGRVTLWPLAEAEPAPEPPPWSVPERYASERSAQTVLAAGIAAHIARLLEAEYRLESRRRGIRPGDILILIRRRDALVAALMRELKQRGVAVAGADRLVLTDAQAVSDLLALCDSLLLPQDDLAFAQFLASPLGGLSDESLMALAAGRRLPLFATLAQRGDERPDWQAANGFFQTLRSRADFDPPFALLSRALGPLGGRARLLRRLGPEAAEPIDELLSEALAFAAREPPSLQHFVAALRRAGAEIKRESDAAGAAVRIMTVHGAKGLQAPLVILPDTVGLPRPSERLHWLPTPQGGPAVPIYCPRAELRPDAVAQAGAAEDQARRQEYNRLLYVALTRAEDELLICGARPGNAVSERCWYEAVRRGFERLGIAAEADGTRTLALPQIAAPDRVAAAPVIAAAAPMPGWAGAAPHWQAIPPRAELTRPEPLAPSRSAEADAGNAVTVSPLASGSWQRARASGLAKGQVVHALLQHLPEIPEAARAASAARYLDLALVQLPAPERRAIAASVLAILEDPALRPLFGAGSRAEVPVTGVVGEVEIGGLIDRLAVTNTQVLLADYKTDRQPPASPAAIPEAYLRQLAAYRALLAQIYPDRPIRCLLIWTAAARPMAVADALLDAHRPGLARS